MERFILQLGTMSLQACIVIAVVFLVRFLFHKVGVSKKYTCLLWILPYLCMICPWKLEGDFGFWRQMGFQIEQSEVGAEYRGTDVSGIMFGENVGMTEALDGQDANTVLGTTGQITQGMSNMSDVPESENLQSDMHGAGQNDGKQSSEFAELSKENILPTVAGGVWVIGLIVVLIYSADAHLKLHTKLICCMKLSDKIYLADDIDVPFVMGIWRPRIYLPTGMTPQSQEYVIAHERTHIKRRDPLKKTIAFLITCIHWFNPLAWAAFHYFGKDMEMACDEETVQALGLEHKKDYATVLLQISSGRRMFVGAPLAFGEGSVKARIRNIVALKKTWRVISMLAVLVVLLLAVVFMTRESAYTTMGNVDELMEVSTVEQDIYLTMDGQTAQLAGEGYFTEVTDFLREMKISRKEESLSRAEDRPADVVVQIGWDVYKFPEDCSSVWLDDGVKPSFSYEVKNPGQVKEILEALMTEWQEDGGKDVDDSNVTATEVPAEPETAELLDQALAERIYSTLRENRDISQYITCTLPEGTWLGEYEHESYVIDVYKGSKILGDFEKQGHYDCAADTWCSLCAPGGIGIAPNVAQGGYDIMEFEDGKPVSVHWYSNHSNFKKVGSYVDDFAMPALLYEGEVDLFTPATAEQYAQRHNLKVGDLKLTAKFWFVFFGEEDSDFVYTVYLNQEYFSKEDMMELARSVQFVQQFPTNTDEDSAEEAYSVTDHLAAHGVDSYENEFVKLDAVEGLSYVGEANGIGIYNQDYYCGRLRIQYFMDIKFADTWQDDRQLELILDSMGLGKSGYVELLEHKTVDGVERYVYEGGVRPFDYADGEWLVGAGIFPSEEAAGEEARVEAVVLFGEADLGVGFCLSLNKTIVTEEKFRELVDAISFKEDAFTMINVAEIAFAGATTPSMDGTFVMQREFAKRLTYDIEVGELTYQVPEHTVALQTGANSWELYVYDSGNGDRWVGTVYAGTVSEVETVSEGCGIPMEEKAGVYYYETPLFSEEQQAVLSGRANTDMLKNAMKKYTQEILISKDGEHMIRVVMVDLN